MGGVEPGGVDSGILSSHAKTMGYPMDREQARRIWTCHLHPCKSRSGRNSEWNRSLGCASARRSGRRKSAPTPACRFRRASFLARHVQTRTHPRWRATQRQLDWGNNNKAHTASGEPRSEVAIGRVAIRGSVTKREKEANIRQGETRQRQVSAMRRRRWLRGSAPGPDGLLGPRFSARGCLRTEPTPSVKGKSSGLLAAGHLVSLARGYRRAGARLREPRRESASRSAGSGPEQTVEVEVPQGTQAKIKH